MENERYSLEKAQEEAAMLRKKVESGEATDYSEAEKYLDNKETIDADESEASKKIIEFDPAKNPDVVFHNPGFSFDGLGGIFSIEQILKQGILSKKFADRAKIKRSYSGYNPDRPYDSGERGIATLDMEAYMEGYGKLQEGGLGRDILRRGISLMVRVPEQVLHAHERTYYRALKKAIKEDGLKKDEEGRRVIDSDFYKKYNVRYTPEGLEDVTYLNPGEIILKNRVKSKDIIGINIRKDMMELTKEQLFEKLTKEGIDTRELIRVGELLGITDLPYDAPTMRKVTEYIDINSPEFLRLQFDLPNITNSKFKDSVLKQLESGAEKIKLEYEFPPEQSERDDYKRRVRALLENIIYNEKFKEYNTIGDYILSLARQFKIPVYVNEILYWPKK